MFSSAGAHKTLMALPGDCYSPSWELSDFLADPEESVHRFAVRKDRRKHLHQIIDRQDCDVTHVPSRTSSPFTPVCTETTASCDKACPTYERD